MGQENQGVCNHHQGQTSQPEWKNNESNALQPFTKGVGEIKVRQRESAHPILPYLHNNNSDKELDFSV